MSPLPSCVRRRSPRAWIPGYPTTPSLAWTVLLFLATVAVGSELERLDSPAEHDLEAPEPLATRPARGFLLETSLGLVRWKWNEVVPFREDLEELGYVPAVSASGTWILSPLRLGASLEILSGAIAYQGYLQSTTNFSLVAYESNSHYLAATPEVSLQLCPGGSLEGLRPVVSLSRPWWRRTLDGTRDQRPGAYGYVETWSVWTLSPGLEVGRRVGSAVEIALTGQALIPLSTSETIVSRTSVLDLQPKTRTGVRLEARGIYRGAYLAEIEFRSVRFEESDPVGVTSGGVRSLVYQPESRLQRITWRVGRIF